MQVKNSKKTKLEGGLVLSGRKITMSVEYQALLRCGEGSIQNRRFANWDGAPFTVIEAKLNGEIMPFGDACLE